MDNQVLNPEVPGSGAAPAVTPPAGAPPPQPSIYEELQKKKGFKSTDEFAKSYVEAEQELGKRTTKEDKIKKQLESAGYTVDENGDIKQVPQVPGGYPPQGQPPPGNYPPAQQEEPIYDPYTGQVITDPFQIQLARMPVGQREAFVFDLMTERREKLLTQSIQAEAEILSKPEAKGFEEDVKKVIQGLPFQHRADKRAWEDALLRVKGMRYDQALKNAQQQGVEAFVEKGGLPPAGGAGGSGGGVALDADQEQIFRYYQQNHPGMFKDRAHFARVNQPNGGR